MTRCLVTGATGFVGSRLVQRLVKDGHAVGAIVRMGSATAVSKSPVLEPPVATLVHDGSTESMHALIAEWKPTVAFHLATHFVARHQPDDIEKLIDSNIRFGCQLLDGLARNGVDALVNVGTAWQHFETDAYRPVSLYAATKQAFDDLATFYADAHGLRVTTLKLTDTYGPGDARAKLVPLLCRAATTREPIALSPGAQIVNFVHIDDVLDALVVAAARAEANIGGTFESFSIRGAEMLSLKDFVALFEAVAGSRLNIAWGARPYRDREVMTPWLGALLPGWAPSHTLRSGLGALL